MARKPVTADTDTDQMQDVIRAKLAENLGSLGTVEGAALAEAVRDIIAAALVAGANVTITPNDGADTITIAATGGGGGFSFADPNADRIGFWDDSAGAFVALTHSAPLTISGTTLSIATATESAVGVQEFASAPETVSGASGALSVHPAGLLATRGLAVGVNAQTGTTYAPVLADQGKVVTLTNAGAITVTMPSDATTAFPVGTEIMFNIRGAGMATFVAGASAAVEAHPSAVSIAQYCWVGALKIAANTWSMTGALA